MKRFMSIVLASALTLAGTSAALAKGYGGYGSYRGGYGYGQPYNGGYGYSRHNNGAGTAAAVGLGILALGLIGTLASQNNRYDRGYGYYGSAPSYGYGNGYGYGGYAPNPYYGSGYGNGYGSGGYGYYGR